MKVIGHFINGKEVASKSDRSADIFNPATGEIQNRVSLGLASELDDAVQRAMKAQPEWGANCAMALRNGTTRKRRRRSIGSQITTRTYPSQGPAGGISGN